MAASSVLLLGLALAISCHCSSSRVSAIGVNWGTAASHPLPPTKVVELLKANNIAKVKLFDADPPVLESLSGSNIDVTVGIPNSMLRSLNSSTKAAQSWVHDNLKRYLPNGGGGGVRIQYVAVGDEAFLDSHGVQFYPFVVGAAVNIQTALMAAKLENKVKVVVPCSADTYESEPGLPPSKGQFRPDTNRTMTQLLAFLSKHSSPFVATISPFVNYHQKKNISLDFALFKETAHPRNDTHKRSYRNSFDLSYDTLVTALSNAGYPDMEIVIGKIGWPTDGAPNATPIIAESFMKGLMARLHSSKSGTPIRPRTPPQDVFLFSLVDEDQESIATGMFERHWGIFTFDGQAKYQIDLGQEGSRNLVNAQNVKYLSPRWCVVNNNRDLSNVTANALEACSVADCSTLSPGGSCFNISWPANISYAFNSYYQQHNQRANSCDFGGLGLITNVDPSVDKCRFTIGLPTSSSLPLGYYSSLHFFHGLLLLLISISSLYGH